MRAHFFDLFVAALLLLAGSTAASAQQTAPSLPRADAWGSLGWALDRDEDRDGNGYRTGGNRRVVAGIGGAVYWAPSLRLDVETSTPNRSAFSHFEQIAVGNTTTARYSRMIVERWGVATMQSYEFLANAWFTPYLGIGFDVVRQTREEYVDRVSVFDPVTHVERVIDGAREIEHEPRTVVRPLAAVGFKGYLSRRAFFRSDARVAFQNGVDEVRLRFGFGVDF